MPPANLLRPGKPPSVGPRTMAWFAFTPPGLWIILGLALVSAGALALLPSARREPLQFWIFARQHQAIYLEPIARWNREHAAQRVEMTIVNMPVMEQRMMSGFLSRTPVADVMEVERSIAGRAFTGPLEDVGFLDLTDRLKREGLLDAINAPSFSPWTSRGRVFGLPHDVHPVMLLYRADVVEAAGIDMAKIETWEDYFRLLRPLMIDVNGDGRVDRYLLNASPASQNATELLLLQAGGTVFDEHDRLTINSRRNAWFLARLATWHAGPNKPCRYSDLVNSASGQQLFLDGMVVGVLTPDWLAGLIKQQVPGLAGKVKLMPLPAWEHGGRRTSVWGGTMLGLPKTSPASEATWEFAKAIYLSRATAENLFRATGIVTPVKAHWSNPIYDQPDPFFNGQPIGRLFLDLAPSVPIRTSSPFNTQAVSRVNNCLSALIAYANARQVFEADALEPEAQRLLDAAQREIAAQIARNVFLAASP